ncbi:MAG: alpha-ribazole phosphatase [Proteobacteria bacterium]|nr:MAG: alpha-ribazole phosphatase [Pseudomonadota bacterium]PIE64886.1 MAG: alpha-ribazole phosphatase [Desulfobacterales bacterium]
MTTIYLIRHGEIDQGSPRRYIGQSDIELSPAGRKQMISLADFLKNVSITGFYCSPLQRCRESAEILCSRFPGTTPEIIDGLKEISLGLWEGLTIAEVKNRYPGSFESRGEDFAGYRPPGGESFADLQQRAWAAFVQLIEHGPKHLAIIAHAGVNRTLLCTILGMNLGNLFQLNQDYGCLNLIRFEKEQFSIQSLNICPHSRVQKKNFSAKQES